MPDTPDQLWTSVDQYLTGLFLPPDAVLDAAVKASDAGGLEPIAVSPIQGKFLHLLAKIHNARKILEIGTLGGYSTIWLGRALPAEGRLISLEADPKHAEIARANIARANLSSAVQVRLGRAQETLPKLIDEGVGPFDMIFIDADKTGYPDYFSFSMKLSRRGTLIVADNVIRKGAVADPSSTDANVQGVRHFNALVAADKRVSATALQTVGAKGYDGFTIVLVTDL